MRVAFVNENTLGHASYVLPFVEEFHKRPELGIEPHLLNATPLPRDLKRRADRTVRGFRRWDLDFHVARWRMMVSQHVRGQLDELHANRAFHTVVANTQSVALDLADFTVPVFVCLDATFAQLAASRWFAPNPLARLFHPVTLAGIKRRERALFKAASRLFPWSPNAQESLARDYAIPTEKVTVLPPSVEIRRPNRIAQHSRPQLLFVGSDFKRKGGSLLLDCFRQHFAGHCDLHVVTESEVRSGPCVFVHRGISRGSDEWLARWTDADVFVFPSELETFGIVLIEALNFEVPVVSADVGAARFVLNSERAGRIVANLNVETLASAIRDVLSNREAALDRTREGRRHVDRHFNVATNAEALAHWIGAATERR